MDAFILNSFNDLKTYISDDILIGDINVQYDAGFIITLLDCNGLKSVAKKYPFMQPYIYNGYSIKFKIKMIPSIKDILSLINRSETKYSVLSLNPTYDNIVYTSVILSTVFNKSFIKLTNRLYKCGNIFLVNDESIHNIKDYIDTYINLRSTRLYISKFLANLYSYNKYNANNLYIHPDLRYNLIIDTYFKVCIDDKCIASFNEIEDAVKYLMFLTFADKEMYNKYIATYPNFIEG